MGGDQEQRREDALTRVAALREKVSCQGTRERGSSKIKRWSRTAAGKKVKPHPWANLDHLSNLPKSPDPERTLQISCPSKANRDTLRLHQSLWGSSPLHWHGSSSIPQTLSPHFISCCPQVSVPARPSPCWTGSSENWFQGFAQLLPIRIWPKSFSLVI